MASLKEYKCPNCGGTVHFDSSHQSLFCISCQTELSADGLAAFNEDIKEEERVAWETAAQTYNEKESEAFSLYSCRSCGGEVMQENVDITSRCPFCGNEVVNIGKVSGDLKPDMVIPFQYNREQAIESYLRHTKKKYVPQAFLDKGHIEDIRGIYVPFWLFDADTESDHRYHATISHSRREGDYQVTRTDHYLLLRSGSLNFSHVPADSSGKMDDTLMEAIEPFHYQAAVDFNTAYLAGYLANRYDVRAEEVEERAKQRIRSSVTEVFYRTCDGYAAPTPVASAVNIRKGKKIYALFPVWLLVTGYKGKLYTFAMNGQTGKFVGNIPADKKAVFWDIVKWFLVNTTIIFLLLWFLANRRG